VLPTLKKLVEELSCDTPSGMGMFGFVITSMASVVGPSVKFEKNDLILLEFVVEFPMTMII
jgi:hypothetical protein